jgi:ankyrin repeat protein
MNKFISILLSTLLIGHALQAMDVTSSDAGKQLIKAAGAGNLAAVEKFLAEGVNLDYQNSGRTALMVAAIRNHLEICKLLITNGASVNLRSNIREDEFAGESALMAAARRGNLEICKLFLEHGANVNQLDNFGRTALQEAISWARINTCKLLIDATLEAPIDSARLTGINLTPAQRSKVIKYLDSLQKTKIPGHQHLHPDTRRLIAQSLSNAYKLSNMIRAQIAASNMQNAFKEKLFEYLDQK